MKIAILSLVIAIGAVTLCILQFEKVQVSTQQTQEKLDNLNKSVKSKIETLNQEFNKLAQQQALLSKGQSVTWVISEAEYLVQLAQLRVQVARDVKTAIQLLKAAEDKIQPLHDPRFTALSEALLQDRLKLENLKLPSLEELWLKLDTLIAAVKKLPIRGFQPQTGVTPNEGPTSAPSPSSESTPPAYWKLPKTSTIVQPPYPPHPASQDTWKEKFLKSLLEMQELVKIRYHSKPIKPLLTETEQSLVKENLVLLLEEIRFSILNAESKIYQEAIKAAQNWISEYFEDTHEAVKDVQGSLKALAEINVRPELPLLTSIEQFDRLKQ